LHNMPTTSAVNAIPVGFHSITPYLICEGANKVIAFIKAAFGAEERFYFPRPDGSVGHAEFRIGSSMLELADAGEAWKPRPCGLHLYVPSADEVYALAIKSGGESLRKPTDQPYGDREAGVKDSGGNHWWIATHTALGPGKFAPEGFH